MILAKKFHNFLFKFLFEIEPEFRQYAVLDKKKPVFTKKKSDFSKGLTHHFSESPKNYHNSQVNLSKCLCELS